MIDLKILSYALLEKKLFLEVQSSITPDYFEGRYRPFYKLLLICFNKFKEVPTPKVMEEQGKDIWTEEFSKIYTDCIEEVELDVREFQHDLEKFRERHNSILLQKFTRELEGNWNGEKFNDLKQANKALKKLSISLDGIYNKKVFKESSLSTSFSEAWERYKQVKRDPNFAKGLHLGLREFDRITNGLQKSELMFVGGESSAGKSALCMNMAINAWLGQNKVPTSTKEEIKFDGSGCNVLYVSIEMPHDAMRRRVDSNLAGIPLYGLRDGKLTPEEEERFKASLKFQRAYPCLFQILDVPRGCTMGQIESKYVELREEGYEIDLIVIDYITLMTLDADVEGQDWLGIGKVAEQMHEFCRTYETRVISPVQLTRPPKQNGKESASPADQHRVGRSIMLSQNANIVLNIESRKDEDQKPDMIVRIAKMRDGEKGAFSLNKALYMMRIYDDLPDWTPEVYLEAKANEI